MSAGSAILMRELLDEMGKDNRVQIFGTDLSIDAIDVARNGIYRKNIADDITPERLKRFFTFKDDSYQVNANIREMLVFAVHNLTKEPPFLRMDLISVRNLIAHRKIRSFTTEANLLLFHAARELLFNVVKHSGVKTVRAEVEQSGGYILLNVEDEGVGFDTSQLHIEKRQSGGAGLLGIQERISYIGGNLEIDSAPGRGSRFKLTTPISILAGETESAIREEKETRISVMIAPELGFRQTGGESKVRIMLVDDHLVLRQGLAGLLRCEPDFEIAGEASDGEAAVKLARELRPDVVLMDISMPGMDGIEATRIIHRELQGTRVIGLSMFQEPEWESAMREAGAVGYLSKSGPAEAVIDTIRACVSAT